ncbi:MAG TPA: UDP-N-acetylmuramoyl-L-alanyl-D-glutamate--2,6-diaminopimelate ligase [Geminicoccaceae bacterium]|nr:UDP-N-acetylmuramoyl-L-alanyl-D-glutamate--2,6-diaminopimelate ligase [Geminicoccaceae bacterium]
MRLSCLLAPGLTVAGDGQQVEITGLTADSRQVRPGTLFVAMPGSRADGRDFIDDAVARGAAAVLTDPSLAGRALPVPLILDDNPRRRLALLAARWFERQPACVVAVTGTNGKTSVAGFTRQIWAGLGLAAGSLGTLGLDAGPVQRTSNLTTPDPVLLHALLAEVAAAGIDHLALEASSHGLDQHRLDGVRLVAAAFTNLSRDHFDYHGSLAGYLAAKRRLFSELLPPEGVAVLNADQPEYAPLAEVCRDRGIDVLDYGWRAARLRLIAQTPDAEGQAIRFALEGREHRVRLGLVGRFQAANVLAALGLAVASGADPDAAAATLSGLHGVRGRLERIPGHPRGAQVFVDYAHTPDALDQALQALRPHAAGRLIALFGCGGDRDPGKRAEMGRIAAARADRVVVTDDNPRSEEPAAIRRAILTGCPDALEIGDRREAIRAAVAELEAGDVLLVAGKGHESGQIVGDRVLPFDDAAEVRGALAALGGGAP